jgi:hypothetical protein
MRNTLRLLGIIALAALIGFGLIACNDGSTSTDDTVNNKTPIESDYDIECGEHIYDGYVKVANIQPKSGKSQGAVHVYYNGKTDKVPPKDIGDYEVTFDVMPVSGWNKAEGLKAGTLSIVSASSVRFHPVVDDFIIEGTGTYPLDGSIRRVTVVAKDGKTQGPVTIFYNGGTALPSTKDAADYAVTFNVGASGDYYAATGLVAGNLTIMAARVPELGDFDISGRSQIYDPVNMTKRLLNVVPKAGGSQGRIFQKFTGIEGTAYPANFTAPWTVGTYNVEITVEQWENYEQKTFDAGVMKIELQRGTPPALGNPSIEDFDITGSVVGGDWDKTWTFPQYDGTRKVVSVNAIKDKTLGVINVRYFNFYGNQIYGEYMEEIDGNLVAVPPKNAGDYQVLIEVGESYGYNPSQTGYYAIKGPVITIPKRTPKPEDFEVWLGAATGNPGLFGVGQASWRNIDENNEIGPYTYKNKGYSVRLRSKVDKTMLDGVTWTRVTYNDKTETQYGVDIGPKNAGKYAVKLDLLPSDNYTTYAGFAVGTLEILKATPAPLDYILGNDPGTYQLTGGSGSNQDDPIKGGGNTMTDAEPDTGEPSIVSVTRRTQPADDDIVCSPAKVKLFVNGVEVAKTTVDSNGRITDSYENLAGDKTKFPANAGKYPITLEVEGADNWNAATIKLGDFEIKKAVVKLEDFDFTNYFAQTAYTVVESLYPAKTNRTNGKTTLKYFKYNPDDVTRVAYAKANEGRWTEKLPQTEGYYRVLLYVEEGDNYLAANYFPADADETNADISKNKYSAFKVVWDYIPGETTAIKYGLVVNPVYIRSVTDYRNWVKAVKGNIADGKLDAASEFVVNFEITEPPLTEAQGAELKTLLQDPAVKIHANFAGTEIKTPADKADGTPDFEDLEAIVTTTEGTSPGSVAFGAGSFEDCVSLLKVTFPPELADLGTGAFKGCSNLKDIDMGAGPVADGFIIGEEAFKGTVIEKLVLASTLGTIGKSAFEGVETLKAITVPGGDETASLAEIHRAAFKDCVNLAAVDIPNSVTRIDVEAFAGCSKLVTVYFIDLDEIENLGEGLAAGEEDLGLETFPGDLVAKFTGYPEPNTLGGAGLYRRTLGYEAWTNQDKPYGRD